MWTLDVEDLRSLRCVVREMESWRVPISLGMAWESGDLFEEDRQLTDALLTSKLRACYRVGGVVILDPVVADLSQRLSGLAMKSAVVARKILGTGSAGLTFKQALVAFLGHGV